LADREHTDAVDASDLELLSMLNRGLRIPVQSGERGRIVDDVDIVHAIADSGQEWRCGRSRLGLPSHDDCADSVDPQVLLFDR
jgi:hypothetical protein